jgi:hypothetical protein
MQRVEQLYKLHINESLSSEAVDELFHLIETLEVQRDVARTTVINLTNQVMDNKVQSILQESKR